MGGTVSGGNTWADSWCVRDLDQHDGVALLIEPAPAPERMAAQLAPSGLDQLGVIGEVLAVERDRALAATGRTRDRPGASVAI
jgi:hypothetical protein